MKEANTIIDKKLISGYLKDCWSISSGSLWTEENPSCGQCGVTSLVIQDNFGGEILKTMISNKCTIIT